MVRTQYQNVNRALLIDFRKIASAIHIDFPAGASEQLNGCVLQASFGNPQFQNSVHLSINLLWIKYRLSAYSDGASLHAPEETAFMAGMAGGAADLFHFQQHRIVITVDADFLYDLTVAGCFAFDPEFFSGSAIIRGFAG